MPDTTKGERRARSSAQLPLFIRDRSTSGSQDNPALFGWCWQDGDQASDYAFRKGMTLEKAEKWLASNLAYDPEQ